MKKNLLLFCLLTFSFGFSQDWREIYNADGKVFYYKPNNKNTSWIKIVSSKLEYFNKDNKKLIIDGYQLSLYKYDCESKKIGILQLNTYSKQGKVLNNIDINDYLVEMNYVVPGSVGEVFLQEFCSNTN